MFAFKSGLFALVALRVALAAPPSPHGKPFEHLKRQANSSASSDLEVDLGYEIYQGEHNESSSINYWKG